MRKCLIAIDGLDASGKETQTLLLTKHFDEKEIPHRYISFPTYDSEYSAHLKMYLGGKFGSDPNAVNAYAASSFFASDRYCSYMLDWKRDYEGGSVILANRYSSANAVHQLSKLPPEEYDGFLSWLDDFEFYRLALPRPDAVVYLCLKPELTLRLLAERCAETGVKKDIHESNRAYIESSYRAALYSAEKLGWITVDCGEGNQIRTREDIHGEITERLKKALPELML